MFNIDFFVKQTANIISLYNSKSILTLYENEIKKENIISKTREILISYTTNGDIPKNDIDLKTLTNIKNNQKSILTNYLYIINFEANKLNKWEFINNYNIYCAKYIILLFDIIEKRVFNIAIKFNDESSIGIIAEVKSSATIPIDKCTMKITHEKKLWSDMVDEEEIENN